VKASDLRPAKDFANQFGVKAVVYGPPGSGKTPLLNTAPRPLLLACEPGLLSMRNSTVPTYQGFTVTAIDEFFKWFFNSEETKNFDTIGVDSISQMADIYLQDALKTKKHGLQAYGDMATKTMEHLRALYYTRNKHTYLIAKEAANDDNGIRYRKPFMPGQQLPVELPHLFDEILHLGLHNIPGMGTHKAFRCQASIDVLARDRTGQLAEFEPPEFGQLVRKAMQ
jgi:hypothetical protein